MKLIDFEEENLLKADGFDEAIVGVGYKKCNEPSIVYDYDKCVVILMERDEMSYEDALEFMDYNVTDAYVGPNTPIFMKRITD